VWRLEVGLAAAALLIASPAESGPALLFDAANGRVLYAEDQDDRWHPASLTKIMTAYVTFEALKEGTIGLETKITASQLASSQPATRVGLVVGAKMSVQTALRVLIIHSANDVAVMLAEAVAGSHEAFVSRMNATAARLGMTRTRFVNANGLPDAEQVTTARDLARLASAVVRHYPEHAQLWSMLDVHIGKQHFGTYNGLLVKYAGADGMKTGFTCDSGFNVVASASRSGQKLIAVVLGENTGGQRSLRASSLLEYGFAISEWKELLGAERIDSLPMDERAKAVISIKQTVISAVCGTARRVVAKFDRTQLQAVARGEGSAFAAPKKSSANGKRARVSNTSSSWVPW
jgi:D-alanyl-D-alanine carboxypeptidase